jgi:feruloyl esterase
MYKYLVFDDPDWDYTSYDFSGWVHDTRVARQRLNATNTDLTAFEVAGGKLILWNGWADAAISALGTIKYYEGVLDHHPNAEEFARLFLLPGVGHCTGGPGADVVDWLRVIQAWVENGEAPSRLTSTKLSGEGEVVMSRPICAYPAKASYDGVGDPNQEASFECSG